MGVNAGDIFWFLRAKDERLAGDLQRGQRQAETWASRVATGIGISLGDALTRAVWRGIGAVADLGRNMVQFSADSRQAVRNIQSELGATTAEAELLGQVAEEVWAHGFTDSVLDAAAAVSQVRRTVSQLNAEQIRDTTQAGLAFRDAYGQDLQKTLQATTVLMDHFGLSNQEALDFIAAGFQQGLDASGDFVESITEYGTQFAAGQANAGQFFSVLQSGLQGGVLGTDKAADMFKEFRVRLLDGSEMTARSLAQIGLSVEDVTDQINAGTLTTADAFTLVMDRLRGTQDQAVQLQAGVGLLGTQFEDLGAGALQVNLLETSMADLAGAADQVQQRYSGIGHLFQTMGRQMISALEPVTGTILDLANQAAPALDAMFQRVRANAATFAAGLGALLREAFTAFQGIFRAIRGTQDQELGAAGQEAGAWGRNIIVSLARGMAAAITAVVQVLNQIGQVIASWLRPGSPPRLLPEIDDWGRGAIQAWVDGMAGADISGLRDIGDRIMGTLQGLGDGAAVGLFNQISQAVSGLFSSFGDDRGDDRGLVGRIVGSRAAIAQVIADLERTGEVGGAAWDALRAALEPLPGHALDYVEAMLQAHQANQALADAQENLNRVTQEYEDQLRPISQELAEIQRQRADTSDQERIAQLQAAIARGALSDEEELAAQQEIRERQLRIQERALRAARDAAVDAAQEQVEEAQAEADAAAEALGFQEALAAAQQENRNLVRQQIQLLDRLAQAMAGIGSALAGLGGGGGGLGGGLAAWEPPEVDLDTVTQDLEDGLGNLEDLAADLDLSGIAEEVAAAFAPLQGELETLGTTFQGIQDHQDGFNESWATFTGTYGSPIIETIKGIGIAFAAAKIATFIGGIATAIAGLSGAGGILGGISAAVAALGGPLVVIAGLVAALALAWKTDFLNMRTTITGLWDLIQIIAAAIVTRIETMAAQVGVWLGEVAAWFQEKVPEALERMRFWFAIRIAQAEARLAWLGTRADEILEKVRTWFQTTIPEALETARAAVKEKLEAIGERFTELKDNVLEPIREAFDKVREAIQWAIDKVQAFIDKIAGIVIPDFLKFDSPPPLAQALAMVADQAERLARSSIPALRSGLAQLPDPSLVALESPRTGGATGAAGSVPGGQVVTFTGDIILEDRAAVDAFVAWLSSMATERSLAAFGV